MDKYRASNSDQAPSVGGGEAAHPQPFSTSIHAAIAVTKADTARMVPMLFSKPSRRSPFMQICSVDSTTGVTSRSMLLGQSATIAQTNPQRTRARFIL